VSHDILEKHGAARSFLAMAESGEFRDFMHIEITLRAWGYYEARGQLGQPRRPTISQCSLRASAKSKSNTYSGLRST
jgi:hypothetical protein